MPAGAPSPSVGVVGHVEWVTHALGQVPRPGAIVDLTGPLEEPAGGGSVAAVAMARVAGTALLVTALGTDHAADRAASILRSRGVEVLAARRAAAQTPVLSITSAGGERTIMVVGPRLQATGDDPLPWHRLQGLDGVYYTGEDAAALAHARGASVLVVTGRRLRDIHDAGVRPDVVVASAVDDDEDPWGLPAGLAPAAIILTEGAAGGTIHEPGRSPRRYPATAPPAPVIDSYGCGDSFAAALTAALARGASLDDAASAGAMAGARCATWRGGLGQTG